MGTTWRLRVLAGVLLLAAGLGCNPLTTVYFMCVGVENKAEPEFKLASNEKNHEVKVLILAYSAPDVQTDQVGIDRQVGIEFTRQLDALCKANKEKVKVIPFHKVEKFKADNPGWQMEVAEIGKRFEADYVIDVEIVALNLYKPGSRKTLFEGAARLEVSALDLHKPQDGPAWHQVIQVGYPSGAKGAIPVGDDNVDSFREMFVRRIATDLCWKFTGHTANESYRAD
jgi:hypothetical protein